MFLLQAEPSIVIELIQQYGLTGAAFALLLMLMMKQNKAAQIRIENLEKQQEQQHISHVGDQKQMISEYVELVKQKTNVLADLTGCLKAMKDTLERMERKGQ